MENQIEKKIENELEAWVIEGLDREQSTQRIPTLGPKVSKIGGPPTQ